MRMSSGKAFILFLCLLTLGYGSLFHLYSVSKVIGCSGRIIIPSGMETMNEDRTEYINHLGFGDIYKDQPESRAFWARFMPDWTYTTVKYLLLNAPSFYRIKLYYYNGGWIQWYPNVSIPALPDSWIHLMLELTYLGGAPQEGEEITFEIHFVGGIT